MWNRMFYQFIFLRQCLHFCSSVSAINVVSSVTNNSTLPTSQWLPLISFLDLLSVHWKLGKGMLHAYKVTQWKTNTMLRNKDTKTPPPIKCRGFIQGFAWSSVWVGRWYFGQPLLCQIFLILTWWLATWMEALEPYDKHVCLLPSSLSMWVSIVPHVYLRLREYPLIINPDMISSSLRMLCCKKLNKSGEKILNSFSIKFS